MQAQLQPPAILRKVLVIINPAAGSRKKRETLKEILRLLQSACPSCEIIYTTAVMDASLVVKQKRKEDWSLILCAGGDGTINEVVNGMIGDEDDLSEPPPLAILPTGSGNGLAREIGLPLDPFKAYQTLFTGTPRPIYLGKVNARHFVLLAGIGLDSYLTAWVEQRSGIFKVLPKFWVYFIFGFFSLFSYSYPILSFKIGDAYYRGSTAIVAKAKLKWGILTLAPAADIEKPSLILCLIKAKGILPYMGLFFRSIFFGRGGEEIEYVETDEIKALGSMEPIEADGESAGRSPALFSVRKKPIYLIHPARSTGVEY